MRGHGARFGRMVNAALFGKRQLRSFTQAVRRLRMRAARHGEWVVRDLRSLCLLSFSTFYSVILWCERCGAPNRTGSLDE
jgi:hypothetical protein